MTAKEQVATLLTHADIHINGPRPWDIQVHDERLYARVLAQGSLGLGEAYMDGWWDCKSLDAFFTRLLTARLDTKVKPLRLITNVLAAKMLNMQTKRRSKKVAQQHYDAGNDLYQAMLDKNMQYSCGYWDSEKTLDAAQEAKLDLIAQKLKLKPGMKVLDIGSGFGGLARHLAKKYKCTVTGYNISKEQLAFSREWCKGLPITFVEADYRDIKKLPAKSFDRVVSVGFFEHVGSKNYRTLFEIANHIMKDDSIFVLHTIGGNKSVQSTDAWINKYIFPNSHLPSVLQISKAAEDVLIMEDWHNFSVYYDKTLMAWHSNFVKAWPKLKSSYNQRFYRMWTYYLLSCAAVFRSRKGQLWQIVFTKGLPSGYQRPKV